MPAFFRDNLIPLFPIANWCWCELLTTIVHFPQNYIGYRRHQAVTWVSVDPDRCCHMSSLGHHELINDSTVFIWKLCWHWLKGLWERRIAAIIETCDLQCSEYIKMQHSIYMIIEWISCLKQYLKLSDLQIIYHCLVDVSKVGNRIRISEKKIVCDDFLLTIVDFIYCKIIKMHLK